VRIAIIGNSGSGKSTLARELGARLELAILDLDGVAWEPGKIAVARDQTAAESDVAGFCDSYPRWVVEGCYAGLIGTALQRSPVLLFVEPGVDACLSNCRQRPWEPHKYASKQQQDEKLSFLLQWVTDYYRREGDHSLKSHQALYEGYQGAKRKLTRRVAQGGELDDLHRWISSEAVRGKR
jgi:adenylate kinase family enzyme